MSSRSLILAVVVSVALLAGGRDAQAYWGIGIQGGVNTPTSKASDLLDQELQLGFRLLLPPYTPFGLIRSRAILLDIGFDLPARTFGNLGGQNIAGQMANVGVLYRLNLPVHRRALLFAGAGFRLSTMLGLVPERLREMLFLERFTGGLNIAGGVSFLLAPTVLFDVRVGYGVFGFEYWEGTAGIVMLFN